MPKPFETTEPYAVAEQYAYGDATLKMKVGSITSVSASRSERQSVIWGEGGTAKLGLDVTGSKGSAKLIVELREEEGKWVIKSVEVR